MPAIDCARRVSALIIPFVLVGLSAAQEPAPSDAVRAIVQGADFRGASWALLAVDAATGDVLQALAPDTLLCPASVTKLFSGAAALDVFGRDFRFETEVLCVAGDAQDARPRLILVASGDPNLSGRRAADGTLSFCDVDHIYSSGSEDADVPDIDALEGLLDLAAQVRAAGIDAVADVGIDVSLFDEAEGSGSGPRRISPVMVNDNMVDVIITPATVGAPAAIRLRPETPLIAVDATVVTAKPGAGNDVTVTRLGAGRYRVDGRIESGKSRLVRAISVDDPAIFARSLFIRALERSGVRVAASELSDAPTPEAGDRRWRRDGAKVVAKRSSPPFSEALKVVLKVSHNLHAGVLPMLIAAKAGKRSAADGLRLQGDFLSRLGLDPRLSSFGGGAGGTRADYVTPRQTVHLLQAMAKRDDFEVFLASLPSLGVDGTLAKIVDAKSPARGKVFAKTGTFTEVDHMNDRRFLNAKALAGYVDAASGRRLVFAVFVNNAPLRTDFTTTDVGRALGRIAEALHTSY